MATGFDLLTHDVTLQKHWLKRFVAAFIDILMIFIPIGIIMGLSQLAFGTTLYFFVGLSSGFIWFAYSSFLEYTMNGTIGKHLFGLRVVSIRGRVQIYQTMMRNLTKIFALFLVIDFLIGMVIETSDPRQRYSDRMAGTSVIVHRNVGF